MSEMFHQLLHLILAMLGGGTSPTTAVLGISVALVALSLLALTLSVLTAFAERGSGPPRPRRAIDISTPLTQSDPDAPGHPRPRAPGAAALAA